MHMSSSIIRRASLPAIMLGGVLLATSAHAQITSAAVGTWASNNNVVTLGGGSSRTIAEFKSDIEAAFTANIGGTIAFDNTTSGDQTSIVSTYNGGNSTLTLAVTGGAVNISSNGSNSSSGTQIMGVSGAAVSRTFTFSSSLSEFGLVVTSRGTGGGARAANLILNFENGAPSVTLTAHTVAETGDNTLWDYKVTDGNNIVSATLLMPDGLIRPDDFGFVVASAIPEPSTYGIVAGGLVLVGAMVVRRRRVKAAKA